LVSGCFRTAVSEQLEYAKNIILEFLSASGFHSTASVSYTESNTWQMPRAELIDGLQVPDSPGLLAELLITHPSISTQTENIDLCASFEAVEKEMKRKRQVARHRSTEDVLRRGIGGHFQMQLNHPTIPRTVKAQI
jgi:hypothetical protein